MSICVNEPCDLRLIGITKHYPEFDLGPCDLEVPRGSVCGLVGRNGAGKTTLMRAALGSLRLDAGRVELFGRDVAAMGARQRADLRARVGSVSAVCPYPVSMRVADVARMHALAQPGFDLAAFDAACRDLDLEDAGRRVRDLSRGMGMKLQLACALAAGCDVLVMDEPTAGLDPIVRDEVLDRLRAWMEQDGKSILISSHITADLEKICDYVTIIDKGRVLLSCERDAIGDVMGVARLRDSELERVLADGVPGAGAPVAGTEAAPGAGAHAAGGAAGAPAASGAPAGARVLRDGLSWALLVPDRAAFLARYPGYVCDRATIDDVMALLVKGEVR